MNKNAIDSLMLRNENGLDFVYKRELGLDLGCDPSGRSSLSFPKIGLFTLVRNEAAFLPEWLTFHRQIGVDQFIIYDHNSTDRSAEIAASFPNTQVVAWPGSYSETWSQNEYIWRNQVDAFRHCVNSVIGKLDWLIFIDVDEFLFPKADVRIGEVLSRNYSSSTHLSVSWTLFGHECASDGLVIERHRLTNSNDFLGVSNFKKGICRPEKMTEYYIHPKPYYEPADAHFLLYHYWFKNKQEFVRKYREPRGIVKRWYEHLQAPDRPNWRSILLRQVETQFTENNTKIFRYIPRIKQDLGLPPAV